MVANRNEWSACLFVLTEGKNINYLIYFIWYLSCIYYFTIDWLKLRHEPIPAMMMAMTINNSFTIFFIISFTDTWSGRDETAVR